MPLKTPETLKPKDIASLFIDVYTDFPRLLAHEHTFLHGARGTGKSMMLRYLEPQVQIAAHNVSIASELSHYAILVPIKSPYYALTELERLEGSPYWLLAEHFMICNMALKITDSLKAVASNCEKAEIEDFRTFFDKFLDIVGADNAPYNNPAPKVDDFLITMSKIISDERKRAKIYITELAFNKTFQPYESSLYDYEDFFLPLIRIIKSLKVTPNGPIFLMLDDVDNLPVRMQKILNTWVSYRTTNDVCLKVSTQQRYRTWRTTQDVLIERTHDFSEIDISTVYTSKQSSHYYDRVKSIVKRRLEVSKVEIQDPVVFFPENVEQNKKLEVIKKRISKNWESGNSVSSRKSDDINRYTVSEYMKELSKSKKQNKYSYSGFNSLVNISSGIIRNFLEPASMMYAEIQTTGKSEITEIPTEIQDVVIYRWSEEYMLKGFDDLKQSATAEHLGEYNKAEKISNLIRALGECFQRKLLSDHSERRLLSFMITRPLSYSEQQIVDAALELGYLNEKSIARKEGAGRNKLYTLNRRLAPYFKLDPSGYATHLSLKPEDLKTALENPQEFVRQRLKEDSDTQQSLSL